MNKKTNISVNPEEYKEKNHIFNVADAIKYGTEKAILLFNLRHWLDKNKANKKHINKSNKDGNTYVWTYNTGKAFEELFPYMSEKSILRWLNELTEKGIILTDKFNKIGYDRTNWYTIKDEYLVDKNEKSISQNEKWNSQNEKSNSQNEKPIPNINIYKPNINTDIVSATADAEKKQIVDISENNKKSSKSKKDISDFSFSEELLKMKDDKRRHIQIIALYWEFKEITLSNRDQFNSAIKRDLRSASQLKGYTDEQILSTMQYLKKNATDYVWKLETVNKFINEQSTYRETEEDNLSEEEYYDKYLKYDEDTGRTYTRGNATADEVSPEYLAEYKRRMAQHEEYVKNNKGKAPEPINFKEFANDLKKPMKKILTKEDISFVNW